MRTRLMTLVVLSTVVAVSGCATRDPLLTDPIPEGADKKAVFVTKLWEACRDGVQEAAAREWVRDESQDPAQNRKRFIQEVKDRIKILDKALLYGQRAYKVQRIGAEHGSFSAWLRKRVSQDGVDATAKELGKRFKYMSADSSRRYLYAVGEEIGEVNDKVRLKYGPAD